MYVSHVNLSSCKLTSQSVWIPFLLLCLVDPNKRRKCVCVCVCVRACVYACVRACVYSVCV